ncbi:MAG TPA: 50S ribosomal protein L21 [Candidatus Hydrogenedentes bacterium]|nr:50S ribosomal protein L21 [Candidatus Hydrogenedentota bacterium]HOL76402.1 50S ribosomal protein L21 [Candidatus Hydrogenedentota bacterium]HPO85440.1 50S ribosomal protein L21 [Candidatus Hydrogenedentota bacterium]
MYAVISTGGKQVKVQPGARVRVERLDAPIGDLVEIDRVCLIASDTGLVVDPHQLAGAKVVCEVVNQGRGKKIRVFKKKRRKNYTRLQGHRQAFTELRVREIVTAAGTTA